MELKHTPGPWKWWTSNSFRRLSSDADGKDGGVICPTVSRADGYPDLIVKDEDMFLIAAAPELLEALRELVFASTHGIRNCTAQVKALEKANQVIAKATGH